MDRVVDWAEANEGKLTSQQVNELTIKVIIFFITLIYRSSNIDDLGAIIPGGLGGGDGELIGYRTSSIFARATGSHNSGGSVPERKVGEGAEIGASCKVARFVVTGYVIAKTIVSGSGPDCGASVSAGPCVTGGVGNKIECVRRVLEAIDLVGGDTVALTRCTDD